MKAEDIAVQVKMKTPSSNEEEIKSSKAKTPNPRNRSPQTSISRSASPARKSSNDRRAAIQRPGKDPPLKTPTAEQGATKPNSIMSSSSSPDQKNTSGSESVTISVRRHFVVRSPEVLRRAAAVSLRIESNARSPRLVPDQGSSRRVSASLPVSPTKANKSASSSTVGPTIHGIQVRRTSPEMRRMLSSPPSKIKPSIPGRQRSPPSAPSLSASETASETSSNSEHHSKKPVRVVAGHEQKPSGNVFNSDGGGTKEEDTSSRREKPKTYSSMEQCNDETSYDVPGVTSTFVPVPRQQKRKLKRLPRLLTEQSTQSDRSPDASPKSKKSSEADKGKPKERKDVRKPLKTISLLDKRLSPALTPR